MILKKHPVKALAFALILTFTTLVLSEFVCRVFTLDLLLLRPLLFYQLADLPVYKASDKAALVYEHLPGSSFTDKGDDAVHPLETKYKTRKVSINKLGLRGPAVEKESLQSAKILLFVGNSNTYGALVNQEDSYVAQLQNLLNEKYGEKYLCLNAGHCAYNMGQKAAWARRFMQKFKPHLIVLEDSHAGRRAFLPNQNLKTLFRKDPGLYKENLPWIDESNWLSSKNHSMGIQYSALYRALNAMQTISYFDLFSLDRIFPDEIEQTSFVSMDHPRYHYFQTIAEEISKETVLKLGKDLQRKNPEIFRRHFTPTTDQFCNTKELGPYPGWKSFSLCRENHPKEYYKTHPPSYVYHWYAKEILKYLEAEKIVK